MTKLLGGQIMFGDFLYCHVSAPTTTVINVQKVSQMFGLTITDNGNGQAFVKGKRAGSVVEHNDDILPGDAILSINGEGSKYYNDHLFFFSDFSYDRKATYRCSKKAARC